MYLVLSSGAKLNGKVVTAGMAYGDTNTHIHLTSRNINGSGS